MIEPATPPNEEERLAALRALDLLDGPRERAFDDIVAVARAALGVEIALVSLVDAGRQWFKAAEGLDAAQTPRNVSFCGHAILRADPLIVEDAAEDPRFHDNPLVEGGPKIRFYAGVPLTLPGGARIGTLCAIDSKPRAEFHPDQIETLRALGRLTIDAIALREARKRLGEKD